MRVNRLLSAASTTSSKPTRRHHAARVATIATIVVIGAYVLAVGTLNLVVVQRLTAQADARLSQRLAEVPTSSLPASEPSSPSGDSDHDLDDAPRFVWIVSRSGHSIALTTGSPPLPYRRWNAGAVTVEVSGSPFRFEAVKAADGWLVAGESLEQLGRVRSALIWPELVFGCLLLVISFIGSLIIGLRASAPLELVHRRQVEFTADASHELRTPLSVIEAEVDLAMSRPRQVDEYQMVLRRIAGEGLRLRKIVDDLLWLARMDDERVNLEQGADVDIAAIAVSSVERFQPLAATRRMSLHVDIGGHPASIHADPLWIERLVGVLVDNACKFAGAGGRVEVTVRMAGNRVVLTVDDSGPGIPVGQRSLVLDRFHRGTDENGGAGLGLAIADSVVRATNGTWLIDDGPLGGARIGVSWKKVSGGNHPMSRQGVPAPDERVVQPTG